ncbi:MAG TPA: hypothetical protein EYP85_08460 [Armatimonadetes bacterium]|nr:hypothetical protein [Armatimonadota bacterium]
MTSFPKAEYRRRIIAALRRLRGQATLGDVVAATGLPSLRAELVLRELLEEFRGHLEVDANGELLYHFPPGLARRTPWSQRVLAAGRRLLTWAYQGFMFLFKVWAALVLAVYAVVYLLILLGALIMVGADVLLWLFIPDSDRLARGPVPSGKQAGNRKPPGRRPFYQMVFAYVFGEPPPKTDPGRWEREVLDFLREHRGRLTAADLMALTGWDLPRAEEELARLVVKYNGEVEVSDNGMLVYTFEELLPTLQEEAAHLPRPGLRIQGAKYLHPETLAPPLEEEVQWRWCWAQFEPPARLNDNPERANVLLTFLNTFNLLFAAGCTLLFAHLTKPLSLFGAALDPQWLMVWLGLFPLAFSLTFFLVPALRLFWLWRENAARQHCNIRRAVLEFLFQQHLSAPELRPVYAQQVIQEVLRRATLASPVWGTSTALARQVKRELHHLFRTCEGELEVDEQGEPFYLFPRLWQEWHDGEQARRLVEPEQFAIREIVYSSAD